MISSTSHGSGPRRPRRAGSFAAAALWLLAACHDAPLASPPPDPDSVLRAATWQGTAHPGSPVVEAAWMEPAAPVEWAGIFVGGPAEDGTGRSLTSSAEKGSRELPGISLHN